MESKSNTTTIVSITNFLDLPENWIICITYYLSLVDIVRLRRTCKQLLVSNLGYIDNFKEPVDLDNLKGFSQFCEKIVNVRITQENLNDIASDEVILHKDIYAVILSGAFTNLSLLELLPHQITHIFVGDSNIGADYNMQNFRFPSYTEFVSWSTYHKISSFFLPKQTIHLIIGKYIEKLNVPSSVRFVELNTKFGLDTHIVNFERGSKIEEIKFGCSLEKIEEILIPSSIKSIIFEGPTPTNIEMIKVMPNEKETTNKVLTISSKIPLSDDSRKYLESIFFETEIKYLV